MIAVLDLDLADAERTLPARPAPAWVLVRWGTRVLGEYRVGPGDRRTGAELRVAIMQEYAPRLALLGAIDVVPARGVDPSAVSIVVCTRDRSEFLQGCLSALDALDPAPGEVIVVDNAPSDDRTKAVTAGFSVRYVLEPKPGLNRARNTGWQSARGSVVAYVDDDARADRNYVAAIANVFSGSEVGAVTGLVRPAELDSAAQIAFEVNEGGMAKGYERRVFHRTSAPVGVESFRVGVGTNLAARRAVLDEIGGFDERIGVGTPTRGGCDLDCFVRVLAAGYAILYEPDALVRHVHRRSLSALLAQMRDYGVSFSSLLMLHASEGRADEREVQRYLRRWHLNRHVRRPLGALRRGDWTTLRMALAEARGGLEGKRALARALGE